MRGALQLSASEVRPARRPGDFQELSTQLFDINQNGKNLPLGIQRLMGNSENRVDKDHGISRLSYLRSVRPLRTSKNEVVAGLTAF